MLLKEIVKLISILNVKPYNKYINMGNIHLATDGEF